jgi:thiol:disulfide interchange protein
VLTNLSNYLQVADFVSRKPPFDWPMQALYIAVGLCCLALALITLVLRKKISARAYDMLNLYGWTNFLIALPIWFFRRELVPILGNQMLNLVHLIAALGWLIVVIIALQGHAKQATFNELVAERKAKYLPKPKEKR